jgi:signal transduction histidine kinase
MQQDTPRELAHDDGNDIPALIASMPVNLQQRRVALGIVVFFSMVSVAAIPFASRQVGRVDAFIPVVQSIMCVTDIITAALLLAQYSIQPQLALLALASGYLCGGLFAFLQTLEFPGAYSATGGLLGGGLSGAAWLFGFWRIIFAAAVIAYALLKDVDDSASKFKKNEPSRAIVITIACALAVTAGLTWLGTAGNGYLPSLYADTTRRTPSIQHLAGALWLLNIIALVLLLARKRTILAIWLAVTVFMSLPDLTWALLSGPRFSLGWYMTRGYSLIASFTVLVVLLVETTMLYARLASAITLQRRERAHRDMSVDEATAAIAHEIRQPLGGISLNCETALLCLEREAPDVAEARECIADALADSNRANEVVTAVRALFKATARRRTTVEVNRLVREVLGMVENDLHAHGTSVSTEFQEDVPEVGGDPTQLQQVILNLVKNAIEAIATSPTTRKAIRLITTYDGKSVVSIYVQDTGPGVILDNETQVFEPFFTTKPSGMGLGLSISRRIIEEHGGNLRLTETTSKGCTFEITLPV